MKQKIALLLMLLFVTITYGQTGSYEVTASELNVREQASKESNAIGKVVKGDIIDVESIEGDWVLTTIINDKGEEQKGYVSAKYIQQVGEGDTSTEKKLSDGERNILIGAGILGLICYIIAFTKVRKGQMTIIVNWYDATLLIATFILPIIGFVVGHNKNDTIYLGVSCILAGLCFLSSLVWSVMANNDNYYHACLSVLAKIFLVFIAFFILLSVFGYWVGRFNAKEKMKQEGYTISNRMEYRRKNENLSMWTKILDYLVISLIGSHK
ncbi:hypothetical protein BPO_0189 [Bergeyella porcorum]|uniref:SH3b domain-containing protein n=1 Tax=Bergeyella porcorum TaxID=1735111 RepID=A0AAU0EYN9_9FLAO